MPKKITALLFICLWFLPLQARGGDDLAKLGKARVDSAAKAYKGYFRVQRGNANQDTLLYDLSVRWLHADLDLATKNEERTSAYAAHLQRMKDWEKSWRGPDEPALYLAIIDATEKEAEYWLAKERAKK